VAPFAYPQSYPTAINCTNTATSFSTAFIALHIHPHSIFVLRSSSAIGCLHPLLFALHSSIHRSSFRFRFLSFALSSQPLYCIHCFSILRTHASIVTLLV
jgi:hypothetical protein